jgi:hypothetical protein
MRTSTLITFFLPSFNLNQPIPSTLRSLMLGRPTANISYVLTHSAICMPISFWTGTQETGMSVQCEERRSGASTSMPQVKVRSASPFICGPKLTLCSECHHRRQYLKPSKAKRAVHQPHDLRSPTHPVRPSSLRRESRYSLPSMFLLKITIP